MAILVAIQAALQSKYLDGHNLSGVRASVAIYFLLAFYFCCTLECVGYVYGCEIWPTHLRSKGSAISYIGFYVFSIWTTAPAAQAFENIGWKFYLVFICVTIALTIPCMFLLPEVSPHTICTSRCYRRLILLQTAGISLEEIAVKFGDQIALDFEHALDTKQESSTHIETATSKSRDATD